MFIQTEKTPNPNSIKFLPGQDVMPPELGTADFRSIEEATLSPLAERLFGIHGVEGVFLGRNFISITKEEGRDWIALKPLILGLIMDHLTTGQTIIETTQASNTKNQRPVVDWSDIDDEVTKQIVELIETRVRPAVARDGGDIRFSRFEHGIVYLELQGACAGCPSSTITLKSGIENMLKHYVPEVSEVRAVG